MASEVVRGCFLFVIANEAVRTRRKAPVVVAEGDGFLVVDKVKASIVINTLGNFAIRILRQILVPGDNC